MISNYKKQLIHQYDKPIIWNLSCFGNEDQMSILQNIFKKINKYNLPNPISTLHGSYSCKYNGGRPAIYFNSRTNIENKIKQYNKQGIGIKLTFSNRNVHADTFEEEEMRWYLDVLNDTKGVGNGIICINDDFAELVKKNYPDLDLVASHVKMEKETKMGITDTVDYYNSKFDLYDIVVFNTFRAFDDEFLSKIEHPDRIEFIVNHSCTTNCPMAKHHHEVIDDIQERKAFFNNNKKLFEMDRIAIERKKEVKEIMAKCMEIKSKNTIDKLCTQFINREEINHLSNTFGINRFKIEGRDLSILDFLMNLNRFIINDQSICPIIHNPKNNDLSFKNRYIN